MINREGDAVSDTAAAHRQRRTERREKRARIHADGVCDPPHPQVPPVLLEALRAGWQARRS